MSHVVKLSLEITDLNAVKLACKRLGWQFIEGQKTYRWFGKWVGDYPMPEGMSKEQLGTCDHVIRVPGCSYEIGLKKLGNKYVPLYDFWKSGGLDKAMGEKGTPLVQAYVAEKTKIEAIKKGYSVSESRNGDKLTLQILVRR